MGLEAILRFGADAAIGAMNRAGAALANLHANAKKIGSGVGQMGGAFANATAAMAPVAAGVAMAGRSAANFEAQMSAVEAKLNTQEKKAMPAFIAKAKQLGRDTQFSATQAGQGMEMLAAAGFKTEDIMSGIDGVLAMAAAEQMDLATAAGITSNVLRGFGLDGTQAGKVADTLAVASAETNTTIAQLGESLSYAQVAAKSMGLDVTQTTAALAVLSNAGMQGSTAGTNFAEALSHLAKPSRKAQAAIGDLGLNVERIFESDQPIQVLTATLADRMKGMGSDVQKTKMLMTIFGQQGGRAIGALITDMQGPEKSLLSLTAKLALAKGAAAEMAKTRMNNFLGAVKLLGSSIEGANIEIFGPIIKALTPIIQDVTAVLNGFIFAMQFLREENLETSEAMLGEWDKINPIIQNIAYGVNDAIDTIISIVGVLKEKFNTFVTWLQANVSGDMMITFSKWATIITIVGAALVPVAAAVLAFGFVLFSVIIPAVSGFITVLQGVVGILTGPVGIAIGAVLLLILALKRENESFGEAALRIWNNVKTAVLDVWNNAILPMWEGIKQGLVPALIPLQEAWTAILFEVKQVWLDIVDLFGTGTDGMQTDWLEVGRTIGVVVGMIAVTVLEVVKFVIHAWRLVIGILKEVVEGFKMIFSGEVLKGLMKLGEALFDYIMMPIRNIVSAMIKLADSIPGGEKFVPDALRAFAEKGIRPTVDEVAKNSPRFKNVLYKEVEKQAGAKSDTNVTVTPGKPADINFNANLLVDGRSMAKTVANVQVEFNERNGIRATRYQKSAYREGVVAPVRTGG